MAQISAIKMEVLPHLPSCPQPLVEDAILKVIIDFCNRSRAYRLTTSDIPVTVGTATYAVDDLPGKTAIAWLLSAELDGAPLDTSDSGTLPLSWDTESGAVTACVVVSDTEIGLRKVPIDSGMLRARLALRPTLNATTYPDELHNLYQEVIAAGVLAKLFAHPNKPWSMPGMVKDCRDRFEAGITAAEFRADKGSANSPSRTAPCFIGGR